MSPKFNDPLPRLPSRRRLRLLLSAVILLVALAAAESWQPQVVKPATDKLQASQPGLYRVTSVVDGDTIEVATEGRTEPVRLIGIDTPETRDPRKPVQCFGEAARHQTEQLVGGKSVRLETEPADNDRDKYRRLLRYVYLPDGTFVNGELVRRGYAFAYTIFPNSKLDQFRAWEQEAKETGRGLWSGCAVDESKQVKQTAPN